MNISRYKNIIHKPLAHFHHQNNTNSYPLNYKKMMCSAFHNMQQRQISSNQYVGVHHQVYYQITKIKIIKYHMYKYKINSSHITMFVMRKKQSKGYI